METKEKKYHPHTSETKGEQKGGDLKFMEQELKRAELQLENIKIQHAAMNAYINFLKYSLKNPK